MNTKILTPCVLAVLLTPGCMWMARGSSQMIEIQTDPPDAKVTIRPAPSGVENPAGVSLARKPPSTVNISQPGYKNAAYIVTASKPGYKDAVVPIESVTSTDTWVRNLIWIHPLLYGLGVLVDMTSGSAYELRPSSIFVKLEPQVGGSASK